MVAAVVGMDVATMTATGLLPAGAVTPMEIAPYVEVTGSHTGNLASAVSQHGLTSFTAAFVLGRACTPTGDDGTSVASAAGANALVNDAKAAGATPIISFGGAAGKELSLSCTNATSLVDAYSAVINRFGVRKIDFDIEGSAITNAASIARRFTAIKALERRFQGLEVSLTVPVGPGGLDSSGVALLKKAKSAGVRVDVVNIMAMDYGDARDMGAAAMSAASGTLAQLKKIWPADTYAHIGITPMIGQNDTPSEQFTYDNATSVVSFARSHGVRRLAFWSLNRDQQCASGEPLSDCSGMAQDPLDYTDAFTG